MAFSLHLWTLLLTLMSERTDCYSGEEDIKCQNNNASTIFYNKTCMAIDEVCSSFGFESGNITHCYNITNGQSEALRYLYKRVLSSEEYFRYDCIYTLALHRVGGIGNEPYAAVQR